MVMIHKHVHVNLLTLRFWCIHWYSLLSIPIKLWSITILKDTDLFLDMMNHIFVWNDTPDQHRPWHALLHLNAPLWIMLHVITIMTPWLLDHLFNDANNSLEVRCCIFFQLCTDIKLLIIIYPERLSAFFGNPNLPLKHAFKWAL